MIQIDDYSKLKIGVKQTSRAIIENKALFIYIARDAEQHVVRRVIELATEKNIDIIYVGSMKELGRVCNIDVGAATAVKVK